MDWLARCVGDKQEFFASSWRRAPVVLRPGSPPVDVVGTAELDALLDAGLLKVPYIGLVHADSHVPVERFCTPRVVLGELVEDYADAELVRHLVEEERATVLLRYVDQWHRGVRELTAGLGEQLGRRVEAFFFRTPAGTQGRPLHRDDADVLAVQISGEKRWYIHAGPRDGNWEPAREDGDPGEVLLETVLRPGEVLYLPRGFAHRAEAVGDAPSAHLSLTVREAGTANLYAVLQAVLADGAQIPGRPLDDRALTEAAATLIEHQRSAVDALTPQTLVALARDAMHAA
ncbi:JmjC domain-containing protein [Streptomyces sp. NPDC059605]|uniref:JmjC domain-containing protein n=1 Tax=unclassified Streptomyces TaxID=2593676 RepID=UPI0036C1CD10